MRPVRIRALHRVAAFTLVEVLAVVVLLALVTGTVTMRLAATSDAARLRTFCERIRTLDAHARLLARTTGGEGVILQIDPGDAVIRLVAGGAGTWLAEAAIPRGVTVTLSVDEAAAPAIRVNRLGQSGDYTVLVSDGDRSQVWRVSGATGWMSAVTAGGGS